MLHGLILYIDPFTKGASSESGHQAIGTLTHGEEDWQVDNGSHVAESITFLSCLEQPEQKYRIRQLPGDTNPSDILKVRQWMSDNRVG